MKVLRRFALTETLSPYDFKHELPYVSALDTIKRGVKEGLLESAGRQTTPGGRERSTYRLTANGFLYSLTSLETLGDVQKSLDVHKRFLPKPEREFLEASWKSGAEVLQELRFALNNFEGRKRMGRVEPGESAMELFIEYITNEWFWQHLSDSGRRTLKENKTFQHYLAALKARKARESRRLDQL